MSSPTVVKTPYNDDRPNCAGKKLVATGIDGDGFPDTDGNIYEILGIVL
ncbi:MAG: hypothetical protein ACI9R3_002629 [Verrucomicrobiales bacterium]|jgi:hypothetical protein